MPHSSPVSSSAQARARRRRGRAAAALALVFGAAACADQGPLLGSIPGAGPTPPAGSACAMTVSQPYYQGRAGLYALEAKSRGDDCETAELEATLVAPGGKPVWSLKANAATMFFSQDAQTPAEMRAALTEWIAAPDTSYARTSDLAPWRSGATQPGAPNAEFPFLPARGVTRTSYERARAQNMPLLCLVQGLESLSCNALDARGARPAKVIPLGIQVFPG